MDLNEAIVRLQQFIRQRFQVPDSDADFGNEVHLFDYGYIDSFGAVVLIDFVEETFAIKIKPGDLVAYPLNTIQEIASFALQRSRGEV